MKDKERKDILKLLTVTAIPIVFQNLLQSSLSFADSIMIGQLGEVPIAAVGLANQMYFFVYNIIFSVSSSASIFTSQFWGSKKKDSIQQVLGISFTIGLILSGTMAFVATFFPLSLFHVFTHDANVVKQGCEYIRLVGISYTFVTFSQIISVTIRSTGDTKTPMIVTFLSLIINIIGNYVLIFVLKMGVAGAAVATTLSRFIELSALFYLLQKKSPVSINFEKAFKIDKRMLKQIMKVSAPVIVDDTIWVLGMTIYKYVYAHMGVSVLASANISESIQDMFFIMQIAIGAASSIIVGNEIGKGNRSQVRREAYIIGNCSVVVGAVCGAVMISLSSLLPGLYSVSDNIRHLSRLSLIALSLSMFIKFYNHVMVCGVIRSGGDTKFILCTELISMYLVGVPAALISGLVFHFPIYYVYLAVSLEEITKFIIVTVRLRSNKWINNLAD